MMYTSMKRTQIYLPEETHQTLVLEAKKEKRSMAEVARELIDKGLEAKKTETRVNIFEIMAKSAKEGPADLSTSYKEYLYGSKSKWAKYGKK